MFAHWRQGILSLATCPNVYVKLGGIAMERNGFGWHLHDKPPTSTELAKAQRPYYELCIEAFGANRCMFESNFPVDKECVSYRTLWNAFKLIAQKAGLSETEKAAIFSGTAARVYRLEA